MKIKEENIIFLEVDKEDEIEIKKDLPKAKTEEGILSEDEIIERHENAEILCPFIYTKITEKVINNLPNLKLIVTRSVGFDHIDLKATNAKNIPVCNVPDYGSHVIAEHVFALLLSSIRHIREGDESVEDGKYDFHKLRGLALKGKTLGVVGTGKIGRNVARIASLGFLMNVIAYDVYKDQDFALENHFTYVPLDEIWEKSDIITFHVPLLTQTKHMVNKETIAKMKKGVILINTARGGIIKSDDLAEGIKLKKVCYAALDVLEHEDNLKEEEELIHLPEVITTPHIAFYADDSMHKMYSEAIDSIKRFIEDKKLIHKVEGI